MADRYDAVVVGSGPNGLAAAITLARAGRSVLVLEGEDEPGGGARTQELTLPGFKHDVCSAIHPLAAASPFFRSVPLEAHGLELVHPTHPMAHPLDDGPAALLQRSIGDTAEELGVDGRRYRRLMTPLVRRWQIVLDQMLGPMALSPRHPVAMTRFGLRALWPARTTARRFETKQAQALFAGAAAHAIMPLTSPLTSAFGLALILPAHAVGWPMARGGSGAIVDAMVAYLRSLGGSVQTSHPVRSMADVPDARDVFFDVSPRQLLAIVGDRLPPRSRRALERFKYGPGVFKVDYALSDAMPWKDDRCSEAGTVHIGGDLDELVKGEAEVAAGRPPEQPFVLVAQQSLFDDTRAPAGKHTLWAYCHVPHGCDVDMTDAIERQLERFAPGFRDCVLARSVRGPAELEAHNPNLVGGDIAGGSSGGLQLLFRPTVSLHPYATGADGIWLCSASSPPGGGVHGMSGFNAANAVLRQRAG